MASRLWKLTRQWRYADAPEHDQHEREDDDQREDTHDMDPARRVVAVGLVVHGLFTSFCPPAEILASRRPIPFRGGLLGYITGDLGAFHDPEVAFRAGPESLKRLPVSFALVSRQRGVIAVKFYNDRSLLQSSLVGLNLARGHGQEAPAECLACRHC